MRLTTGNPSGCRDPRPLPTIFLLMATWLDAAVIFPRCRLYTKLLCSARNNQISSMILSHVSRLLILGYVFLFFFANQAHSCNDNLHHVAVTLYLTVGRLGTVNKELKSRVFARNAKPSFPPLLTSWCYPRA